MRTRGESAEMLCTRAALFTHKTRCCDDCLLLYTKEKCPGASQGQHRPHIEGRVNTPKVGILEPLSFLANTKK